MMVRHSPLAALILAVSTVAIAPGAAHAQDQGTIKIGVPAPLSGSYSRAGKDILNGAQLAAADINAKGGVLGKKIELVSEDDKCDADAAATAAQALVQKGVVAVAGGYCSSAALPELRVFHGAGLAFVMDASTNPELTEKGWSEAFRTIGRDDEQGPFAAKFMKEVLHAKSVAVVNDNTTYSKGLAENTVQALKKEGVEVVYDDAVTPGQMDYAEVAKNVGALKPDVVYYTGYYPEAALIAKDVRQLKLPVKYVMGGDGTTDPTLIRSAGSAAKGMICTTAPLPQFLSGAKARRFVADYKKAYGADAVPGPYSIYEYDAVSVTAKAIAAANSTKREDIVAALHKVSGFKGATGDITFNEKGDRSKAVYMAVIADGPDFKAYRELDANGNWVTPK
ncbi:branched chain amino acid ABC transporter substrate-binding protein [Trinickia dabaoshanensis]|uniref:Branched chain amino acid ABC transporter substrate-binding protein n=1 Tax=Trinickia dabaoshanensis TaxID=564714 RepID=A0A2N7VSC3_9BURK|nr:branched-chain amino acid ABC transporter substrate-binding protein [Trinickia dabaoshanensis]PMS20056.1 branched chain amino acid ABC transporter substrate-binding protein [Trinickia dabaoshanensis]